MHRLFAAIEPPPAVRDRLLAAMGGLAGARWQTDGQLHLTLRFIGEVDRHQAADIAAALASVHAAPFDLSLAAPGTFDRRGRLDTLWIGVTPHDAVAALAARVNAALRRAAVPPETRAYLPHITIARFGRSAGTVGHFLSAPPLAGPPFTVTGFALYESTMGHDGSDYRIVERYRL